MTGEKPRDDPLAQYYMIPPLTEEDLARLRPLAEKRLRTPGLLSWVKDTLGIRIVGEPENRVVVWLCGLSAGTLEDILDAIVSGKSSLGKSWLVSHALRFFPRVMNPTRLTPSFLDRANADLTGVIFYAVELPGIEKAGAGQVNIMISEGELKLFTVQPDEKGRQIPTILKTTGRPVFVTTTVKGFIEEQLSTRTLLLNPDDSSEQTLRIIKRQSLLKAYPRFPEWTPDEEVLRAIPYVLEKRPILIPYAEELGSLFPIDQERARRDYEKLLAVISIIAFLYQKQRATVTVDRVEYIVASMVDVYYALKLLTPKILRTTIHGLPEKAFEILDKLKDGGDLTIKQLRRMVGGHSGETSMRSLLEVLMERGFVVKDESARAHTYSLSEKDFSDLSKLGIETLQGLFGEKELREWLNDSPRTNSPECGSVLNLDGEGWIHEEKEDDLRFREVLRARGTKSFAELNLETTPGKVSKTEKETSPTPAAPPPEPAPKPSQPVTDRLKTMEPKPEPEETPKVRSCDYCASQRGVKCPPCAKTGVELPPLTAQTCMQFIPRVDECAGCGRRATLRLDRSGQFFICHRCYGEESEAAEETRRCYRCGKPGSYLRGGEWLCPDCAMEGKL